MAQSYLFLIYDDPNAFDDGPPDPAVWAEQMALHTQFMESVTAAGGVIQGGEALAPPTAATTVRRGGDGDHVVTDGPFAETKEALGGFYQIECADLDQAIAFARLLPSTGSVEVRPVVDTSGG